MGKAGSQGTPTSRIVDFAPTFSIYYSERFSAKTLDRIDDFIDHFQKHGLFGPPAFIGKISPSYKVPENYPNRDEIIKHARANKLWHVHIGDPCFQHSLERRAPYKVSNWVLHFQKLSDDHIRLLELGYHNPMVLPSEKIIG